VESASAAGWHLLSARGGEEADDSTRSRVQVGGSYTHTHTQRERERERERYTDIIGLIYIMYSTGAVLCSKGTVVGMERCVGGAAHCKRTHSIREHIL
jgi:hypothetical protein